MDTPRITFAGVEYLTPFADLIRPHTDREREALAASIGDAGGVVVPVVTYDRLADAGGGLAVLDGATRLALAAEQGLAAVPVSHLGGLSDAAARALCLTLNADRRHLTVTEQAARRKDRIALAVRLKDEGLSTRAIAKGLGVSQKQVIRDLHQDNASGNGESPDSPDKPEVSELEQALRTLHSTCSALRRAQQALEKLAQTPLGSRLSRLLANHNAECALDALTAALNDLTAESVQGFDAPEEE